MDAKDLQIPDFETAQSFFEEFIEDLVIPFSMGWSAWKNRGTEEIAALSDRTRANIIYDYLKKEVKHRFGAEHLRGTKVVEENGLVFVDFGGIALVRFKKLDENNRPRNVSTDQQKALARQSLELPNMPPDPTFITVGYRLNELKTEIISITMSCWVSEHRRAWLLTLVDENTNNFLFDKFQSETTIPEHHEIPATGPKVSAKKTSQQGRKNG